MDSVLIRAFSRLRIFNNLKNVYKPPYKHVSAVFPQIKRQYSYTMSTQVDEIDHSDKIVQEIAQGNPELENRLKIMMLEMEVLRQDGMKAPELSYIRKSQWEHMLNLKSKSARYKYFGYLWKNEKSDENKKAKKEAARTQRMAEMETQPSSENEHIEYSLSKNSMLLRIYESSMNKFFNHKLMQAMLFGQKLIIDCSYDKYMTLRESTNAAKQITLLFAENRFHKNPFDLHLCNCDMDTNSMNKLKTFIPTLLDNDFPLNLHTQSYTDVFPKERLVYLTPHCRNDLVYNPDDIYIIGCMVDKANSDPISLAKAKEQNLRMARLPLDKYLQWNEGSGKSLTINQVSSIMLDLNDTLDWNFALRHVPRRKLYDPYNNGPEKMEQKRNYKKSSGFTPYHPKITRINTFNSDDTIKEHYKSNFNKRQMYKNEDAHENFSKDRFYNNGQEDSKGYRNMTRFHAKNNFHNNNNTDDKYMNQSQNVERTYSKNNIEKTSPYFNERNKFIKKNKFMISSLYEDTDKY